MRLLPQETGFMHPGDASDFTGNDFLTASEAGVGDGSGFDFCFSSEDIDS